MNFSFVTQYSDFIVVGTEYTIILAILAVVFGTIIGVALTLLRRCKFIAVRVIGNAYIEFIRGTPLLAQIYIIYIGVPILLAGHDIPDLAVGAIALSLNSAAYISETIRSGIEAVSKGQMEAARSLGMNERTAMFDIILPQAFKNILPALGNQFIGSIKDSSIVSVIGVAELMYKITIVRGNTALGLEPILVASFIYLMITFTLSRALGVLERKLRASDTR
ncbi:amino acid ABC transporter permease [Clostridiaceae bacterium UIB06]|uniref:Amino acid ABC transporter permease n=1 Tax=Clostridium thailandense TaxID=2794346 RepID=A0A949WSN7_9CLOT|nr:amino acid ABC transporter permease [Clostridium thailandense]MBV7275390.1 amino acid ABC transporter permease [Clostridium thailandense]MCH5136104.1 amino acid ABC transporter permease [Clostridiaceae bacterium UIB06]